ncbi:hypothetical protein ACWC2T_39350 [Streptomyces sp. NPDC001393]
MTEDAIHDERALRTAAKVAPVPDSQLDRRTGLSRGRGPVATHDEWILDAVGDRVRATRT